MLKSRQISFCEEFIRNPNATQAAIKAGYNPNSARSIGSKNLKKPEIKKYIEKRRLELFNEIGFELKTIVDALIFEANCMENSGAARVAAIKLLYQIHQQMKGDNEQDQAFPQPLIFIDTEARPPVDWEKENNKTIENQGDVPRYDYRDIDESEEIKLNPDYKEPGGPDDQA